MDCPGFDSQVCLADEMSMMLFGHAGNGEREMNSAEAWAPIMHLNTGKLRVPVGEVAHEWTVREATL